ncbi:MAG TPA: hypothetical protein VG826_02115 [Pirellulales bacterium]|nr:hypothetical protein [Pirellulales bacterium]
MKPRLFLFVLAVSLLACGDALVYGRGRGGGGYGGFGGAGTTPFGSAMLGMSAATYAAGTYNLNTARAAVSYQQAYRAWIENQKLREQTYFDMRRMNASYRAEQEMQHPHATPEAIDDFNHSRLPAPLSANEFDPAKGVIEWPGLLNRKEFDDGRARLEGLFSEAADDPHGSGLGTQNYRDIQTAIGEMSDKLHSELRQFKPDEYLAASRFLKSLAFEARTPGGEALAKK